MKLFFLTVFCILGVPTIALAQQWGVVFGADRVLSQAKYEINRAKSSRPPRKNVAIFYRDGWYRSVIFFEEKSAAESSLPNVSSQLRKGSYLINIDEWCPRWQGRSQTVNGVKLYRCL